MTYVDSRGKVFSHLDRLVGWSNGQKPAPVTVEWDLSNRCVLGCQSCHFAYTHVKGPWAIRQHGVPANHDRGGDYADSALVVRVLREMKSEGVTSIVWSGGGEPTTHPQWQGFVVLAEHVGFQQGMYTLGGLIDSESGERLSRLVQWVVVSLDACDAETYGREKGVPANRFEAALNGIESLVGGRAVIGVSFLLHANNWHLASEMLGLARQRGANYTTFRPTIQTSPAHQSVCDEDRSWITAALPTLNALAEELDVEIDPDRFVQYRDWTTHPYAACQGVRLHTTITPDGRVWICPNRREFSGSCIGDLRTESFSEIWARHPGQFTVDSDCRVMCRLHQVNEQIAEIYRPRQHEAFV